MRRYRTPIIGTPSWVSPPILTEPRNRKEYTRGIEMATAIPMTLPRSSGAVWSAKIVPQAVGERAFGAGLEEVPGDLGVVRTGLFITMPYGKFVHGFYRYAALVRNAIEQSKEDEI